MFIFNPFEEIFIPSIIRKGFTPKRKGVRIRVKIIFNNDERLQCKRKKNHKNI